MWQVSAADGFTKIGAPFRLTTSILNGIGEESPALWQMPDQRWLLLHTEGNWDKNYTTVYAVSEGTNVTGPYHDYHYDGVLMSTGNTSANGNSTMYQPGGPDFVNGGNGEFIFGAKERANTTSRKLWAARMAYRANTNADCQ